MNISAKNLLLKCFLVSAVGLAIGSNLWAQDPLAHRKSNLTISVIDSRGNTVTDATIDVRMTRHAFIFGTQIRDRFYSITESAFNSLSTTQRQGLLPNLTGFGTPRYTPTWDDALAYRNIVDQNFNTVIPTVGMQWLPFENNGPSVPDATILQAQARGLDISAASVVWQRDRWPTPNRFESDANPDPMTFFDALIDARLGSSGIMARYSDAGVGPAVNDWKLLNEPLHENYHASTFVAAGIYPTENHALADYFIRANATRPDATLSINEFNILNSNGSQDAREYRDLINALLSLGAPIDRIGVQAHMGISGITKQQITTRLNILAQTGLTLEISEFDMRDDASQLTNAEQERLFEDMLTASFEHPSIDRFNMWGFWDPGHWRGNGPLYDENWNVKDEASPWFDLVLGDWMTQLDGQTVDAQGSWNADVFDGTYEFVVTANGQSQTFSGNVVTSDAAFELEVPAPSVPGDFDDDGDVDVEDIDFYVGNIGAEAIGELAQLDLDQNGTITATDLNLHVTVLVQPSNGAQGALLGDLNLDGRVDVLGDAFILIGNLNSMGEVSYGLGNIDADLTVSVLGDAFLLIANLGRNNDPPEE